VKISIVGTGYVGLVTGVCFAEMGHTVSCVDIDEEKVKRLRDGFSPIYEPGIEKLIKRNVEHERLFFTTDLKESLIDAEVAFIAVGTPPGEDGSADLKYVKLVASDLAKYADHDFVVVVKSTVPVGTCDIVEECISDALKAAGTKFHLPVTSNPEFLKEGAAIDDFLRPDRIVIGVADKAAEKTFYNLYRPFILDDPGKLLFMDRYSSELTKYGSNAMLATRISFMNELSRLCDSVGANVDNIRRGMGMDTRIGKKFLFPGPGYGGSCFPKDVKALVKTANRHDIKLEVLEAVESANQAQKEYVAGKVKSHYGDLSGKKFAVWGLSFKPGTDDVRETPSAVMINYLLKEGATVVAHDPQAQDTYTADFGTHKNLSFAKTPYVAAEDADGIILMTEWSEYRRPNWSKVKDLLKGNAIFDFRNQYQIENIEENGLHYVCVGRPSTTNK
jgi:UDPglucose 6-dehydrogenase